MISFLEPATLLKMNFFSGIFQGFYLKFQRTSFTEHLVNSFCTVFSRISGSSLESYTSKNATQHETTQVQQRQHEYNTSATRGSTTTKQPKIYFDLFIPLLHTRSLIYQSPRYCLCCKIQKTETRFFQQQSKQNQKI